jgi:hypothetical protein
LCGRGEHVPRSRRAEGAKRDGPADERAADQHHGQQGTQQQATWAHYDSPLTKILPGSAQKLTERWLNILKGVKAHDLVIVWNSLRARDQAASIESVVLWLMVEAVLGQQHLASTRNLA